MPPGWKGWQRKSLETVRAKPFPAPNLRIAKREYSEQVGEKRQALGSQGDSHLL